ncbi:uncharacterized protein BXZ73DRAFT_39036, partial [Epithele typhae]|uniref:uncharacterized protein n=1 Tax=Epithele typhae TaxID=378194 RepID=UPI002007A11B
RRSIAAQLKIHRVNKMLQKLLPGHMSGDETDDEVKTHPPLFRMKKVPWRSQQLNEWLWTLSCQHIDNFKTPVGARASPGNPPRSRYLPTNAPDQIGPVAKGLWRNCYDRKWLRVCQPYEIAMLEIIDEDFDFALPLRPRTPFPNSINAKALRKAMRSK